jgi:uncharacterized protein (UPF0276 family)
LPHLAEAVATRPNVGWLEIHPENFLANPHAAELLIALSDQYPISVHTVGLSIGSAEGIDRVHLKRLRELVNALHPVLISGHLAWSTQGGAYLNDLLPLPYDEEALEIASVHLRQVQDALGRQYLVENPSVYVAFETTTMTETEFLSKLVDRTGCGLLCDVSNIFLSAHNMGYDARRYIDELLSQAVGELHLGGFTPEDDESRPGEELLIDTHATPITDPVWDLYAYALQRFGPTPTMIEWDNELPPFTSLLREAARADAIRATALHHPDTHAAAC